MEIRNEEDDTIKLCEASVRGYVPTLNELIQKDPLVLNKISLMSVGETLLHISASLGHLDFTKALLNYKPKLANELDSHNRSALHLASAEGHTEIVKALLHVNKDVCLIADEEGRIPLHYAAMRGRTEVIQLLINERPDSIQVTIDGETTVLRLCVLYNHLEALKVLVEYVNDDCKFLNLKDHDGGNTILHLAVMLKQVETTNYLLSKPEVEKNALNGIGFTALDVIEHCSRDFKSLQIRNLLMIKGVEMAKKQNDLSPVLSATRVPMESERPVNSRWWKKWVNFLYCLRYKGDWLEKTPKTLMLVATVITTTTFQSAINPPGGVWQDNKTPCETKCLSYKGNSCHHNNTCAAGTAVLAYTYPDDYYDFFYNNTVSFVASLCVILLLVSGVPLHNEFALWSLTMCMTFTLTFMGLAYLRGTRLLSPHNLLEDVSFVDTGLAGIIVCCFVIFIVLNTIRFWITLGAKKLKGKALTGPGNMPDNQLQVQISRTA